LLSSRFSVLSFPAPFPSCIYTLSLHDALPIFLKIFEEISPILSIAMSFVLFGMIFNTGLSMFYGFIARFVDVEDKQKNYRFIVMTCVVGFVFSFIGFKVLVDKLYTLIGFAGLLLKI